MIVVYFFLLSTFYYFPEVSWIDVKWVHGENLCVCVRVYVCVCGEVKMVVVTVVWQRAPKSGRPQLLTTPRSLHAHTLSSAA